MPEPEADSTFELLEVIEQQCRAQPETVAAQFSDSTLTYGQLDRASGSVAAAIRQECGSEGLVGIYLPPGTERIIAMLAALRAGIGYVPLDPQYPSDRLQQMVDVAKPAVILAPNASTPFGPDAATATVEALSSDEYPELPGSVPDTATAYVIFTSGSTGTPKGIDMPRRALNPLIEWQLARSHCGPGDVTLQFTPLSFDVSFQEIVSTLASGGTLVVASERDRKDPGRLLHLMQALDVRRIFLPFVALNAIAETAVAVERYPTALREVITAGEQLKCTNAVRRLFGALSDATLDNQYGPAETHVVTAQMLMGDPQQWPDLPAIGKPLPHVIARVAGAHDASESVTGELVIGGNAVADGYVNNPAATRARFSEDGAVRFYQTGDEVRREEDGTLQWLGRLDGQVKVSGVRVEPGDVEVAMLDFDDVQEAAVTVVERNGTPRLAGFYVPTESAGASIEKARIDQWKTVWDDTYERAPSTTDNPLAGWRSSFTGEPIDPDKMFEWADAIATRIMREPLGNVLEIGAGSGLIARRVADASDNYTATDISPGAVATLNNLGETGSVGVALRAFQRPAHDFGDDPTVRYDTIIINSVTQHFPSATYLSTVLRRALDRLAPGGRLFVGDVFDRNLAEHYFTRIASHHFSSDQEIAKDVARRTQNDQELRIAPAYFAALSGTWNDVADVVIELKTGDPSLEMTAYRYDVTIRKAGSATVLFDGEPQEISLSQWMQPSIAITQHTLLKNLVNARLQSQADDAVEPNELWEIAGEQNLQVRLSPSLDSSLALDAWIWPEGSSAPAPQRLAAPTPAALRNWTTHPLVQDVGRTLESDLRNHLQKRLPAQSVPDYLIPVAVLPLTPSGKLDRRHLPEIIRDRPTLAVPMAKPSSEAQTKLASVWKQVLDLREVGIDDPFFDVGGNSLLATRLFVEICIEFSTLKGKLEPYSILEFPTIRRFSEHLTGIMNSESGGSVKQATGARQRAAFARRRR